LLERQAVHERAPAGGADAARLRRCQAAALRPRRCRRAVRAGDRDAGGRPSGRAVARGSHHRAARETLMRTAMALRRDDVWARRVTRMVGVSTAAHLALFGAIALFGAWLATRQP